jgi:acetoin utilization deacetylase AcuC-like enzyme
LLTGFYWDERTFWHGGTRISVLTLPVGHWVQPPGGTVGVDTPDTKRRVLNLVRASGLMEQLEEKGPVALSREDLLRVHDGAYLERFKAASDEDGGELGPAAAFGPGGYEIAVVSAGLAAAAVEDVIAGRISRAYALCRPCGHHCLPDAPMGSCLLSNIGIAIERATALHGLHRIAVVDWDVHHGNGTQAIFYDRPDVLTISIHQDGCFPFGYGGLDDRGAGPGAGCNVNIPLPPGAGHDAYVYAFERIVLPALRAFCPDLIIVASGLDASAVDPLARMMLHSESYRALTAMVGEVADEQCQGRLVVVHEGGYSEAYAPFCGLAIVEELAGVRTSVEDPALAVYQAQQPSARVNAFHRELIDEMASALEAGA